MKFARVALIACVISVASPSISYSITPASVTVNDPGKDVDPALQALLNRVREIKDMNKENLTKSEKKNLRKELKEIKKEIKASNRGIYLSLGAAIIVALLLILLL